MALKTVSQLKDSVAALLSGIDLSNVDNLNGAIERAARILVQKADIPEASGVQNIVLYNGVYDYLCEPKIFGTAINDLRPQGVNRPVNDYTTKTFGEEFDRTKGFLVNGTRVTFEYANGVPIIRVVSQFPQQKVELETMSATTGWVLAGSASNLIADTAVYYQTPASLRFTLTGASTGTLTKTLTNSLDLSTYQDVGVAFLAIRIPDGASSSDLDSIGLSLGSDSGNYDITTASQGFLGSWVAGGWLLVAFDFSQSSPSGTPNWSAIDYIQVSFSTLSTLINFRVGGLWICQPFPAQILYQSAAIFIPEESQTALTTITTNTDTITLNDPAFTLFEYEAALSILQQTGGGRSDDMSNRLKEELNGNGVNTFGLYGHYRGDNPSQELRTIGNYYDGLPGGRNGRF